jgi:1-acyl-sn-glycerol-3-phosphate acyltransferase
MDLLSHLWGMIGLGTVEVVVQFHPPTLLTDCGSRKALAGYCFARVSGGMAGALFGRPQPLPAQPVSSARKVCLAEIASEAAA